MLSMMLPTIKDATDRLLFLPQGPNLKKGPTRLYLYKKNKGDVFHFWYHLKLGPRL
jgi:hypothetical protein